MQKKRLIDVMDVQIIAILSIILVSSLAASILGFGFGLLGMPLLALIIDLKTATPLIGYTSVLLSFSVVLQSRKEVDFKAIWRLIIASIVGIPVGLYLLKEGDDSIMKISLALMIIFFAIYSIFGKKGVALKAEWPSYIFGLLSGIVGSAYNMGGPPVIIYGAMKQWPPSLFRGTLFSFYLPLSFFVFISHVIAGMFTETIIIYCLYSTPIVIFSVIVGQKLNRTIPTERFQTVTHLFLLFIGCSLLFKVMS